MSLSTFATIRGSASGCTRWKVEHFTYDWVIEDPRFFIQTDKEVIYSPIFCTSNEVQWRLCLRPQDRFFADHSNIYLCLHSHKSDTIRIEAHVEISIPAADLKEKIVHKIEGKGEFMVALLAKSLLTSSDSDGLKIHIEMDIPLETIIDTTQYMQQALDSQEGRLIQDFRRLFKEPKFSDLTVIVDTQKFPAHKLVLATRSPVFAAMFENKETQENLKNEIKIEEMEPEVVKAMLEFIYTDEVTNLEELAYGLLEAADKYDLQRLRNMCEKIFCETLNEKNAAEILFYANLHRSYKLKEYVMGFINDHLSDVVETDGYLHMSVNDPELLHELIRSIAGRIALNK